MNSDGGYELPPQYESPKTSENEGSYKRVFKQPLPMKIHSRKVAPY